MPFPASTIIHAASLNKVFMAYYSGTMTTFTLDTGEFQASPGQPVLTPTGWVTASALLVGDNVLQAPAYSNDFWQYCKRHTGTFFELYNSLAFHRQRVTGVDTVFHGDLTSGVSVIQSTSPDTPLDPDPLGDYSMWPSLAITARNDVDYDGNMYIPEINTGYLGVGDSRVAVKDSQL